MKKLLKIQSLILVVLLASFALNAMNCLNLLPYVVAALGVIIFTVKVPNAAGAFGEFVAILDTDSDEVKSAKKTMNQLGEGAVKKAREEAKKEAEELLKTQSKSLTDDFEAKLKVIRDEADKNKSETDEALTALNRFKEAAKANEEKGVHFDTALDKAMSTPEVAEELKALADGRHKGATVRLELKDVGVMGLSSISGLQVANAQLMPGIVAFPNRQVHIRDIMQTGRMTASDFHYLREIGFDGTIAPWVENSGLKPQFDIRYIESIAPSQFIAGFLKISRKALDDITALRSSIAARLLQKYLDAEDAQILKGTGAAGQLLGLFNDANSFTYAGARTVSVERLIDSTSALEELNHNATGIIMRPTDYNNIAMTSSTGNTAGIYSLPGLGTITMQNGVLHINGVPVYKTTAMYAGEALTGDWNQGAMLLIRQDPIVEFFEQDDKNVQMNQITARVEGRAALPVFYSDAFVKTALQSGQYPS